MRLATPESVLGVLGIQTGAGALSTAGAALDATFPGVEALCESGLVRTSRSDSFDIGKFDTEESTLRLFSGFVTKEESVTVSAYGTALGADAYRINYDHGTVGIFGPLVVGVRTITVTYSHGFDLDPSDTTRLNDLPDALVQGGMLAAAAFMMLNPANIAKEKARFMAAVTVSGLELQARNALVRYVRPRGTVVWHSHSEVLE